MDPSSPPTLITTGLLPFLLLASAALTAPVSIALLALYKRAVLRSMATRGGASEGAGDEPIRESGAGSEPSVPLRIGLLELSSVTPSPSAEAIRRSLFIATVVYTVAGLAYAVVLAGPWMYFGRGDGFVLSRFLWLLSCYAWPTALGVGLLVAIDRKQRLAVAGAYFGMLFAVAIYGLLRNASLSFGELVYFWMVTNAPATVLLLAFLHRRVRAVGPLVLAFMMVAVTGSQVAISLMGSSDAGIRAAANIGVLFRLNGVTIFVATMALGALLAAVFGWRWLQWLGRRYLERRTSDQALTLDAMWLLFGVVQSIAFAFEGWGWIFSGLAAFAAYKAVARIGFDLSGLGGSTTRSPSLLLLRVFALGGRSERLFDALASRWLRHGDISLIAGPDLATTTVEPHEFLDFVGGRLSRQFVRDGDDLERRFAARALGPDPDGRYRVNEFFCHANTWRSAMRRLAASADVVLMDLRSFSAANHGIRYELQQLLDSVSLERVLILIDESTDRAILEESLQNLWLMVSPTSPNLALGDPQVGMIHADGRLDSVLGHLLSRFPSAPESAKVNTVRTA